MPSRATPKRKRQLADGHRPAAAEKPISRYPVPALDDLPADLQARIVEVQAKTGFIPNVFLVLAHRPDECRAFFAYYDALMLRDGGLSKAEREMIVVATSAANGCPYCVVAHGAVLRIFAKNPILADQLTVNYRSADITPRQRAMLDFAVKMARRPEEIGGSGRGDVTGGRIFRRGYLGHRRHHGALRHVQPAGAPDGHAPQ